VFLVNFVYYKEVKISTNWVLNILSLLLVAVVIALLSKDIACFFIFGIFVILWMYSTEV
jgi:hypothetical protein